MEQQQQQHGAAAALKLRAGTRTATRAFINPFTATLAAGCAALAVSGAAPLHKVAFSLAWPVYIAAANMLCFSSSSSSSNSSSSSSNSSRTNTPPAAPCVKPLFPETWVRQYATVAAVLALLVPGLICLCAALGITGLSSSSSSEVRFLVLSIVGPHLYLTAAQVLCEALTSRPGFKVSMLPRMLVPIGFNTYRMWALWVWCAAAVGAGLGPWHVGLAAANLAFWAYNMFVFLLLRMLPLYLDPAKCAA